VDSQIKVWDVRKFTPLHTYYAHTPATQLDISQKGLLAVAHGRKVQVRRRLLEGGVVGCRYQSPAVIRHHRIGED
jgi:hypothetical protein